MNSPARAARSFLIKICGISDPESAVAAAEAGADLLGYVFVAQSPRAVDVDQVRRINAALAGSQTRAVALFAGASAQQVAGVCGAIRPDFVQLHGGERDDTVAATAATTGLPIIRAVSAARAGEASTEGVALLLFDAAAANGGPGGGTGTRVDPDLLAAYGGATPFLLAGGLDPTSVGAAIVATARFPAFAGVDVSSGVERTRGKKDLALIRDFVQASREAFAALGG